MCKSWCEAIIAVVILIVNLVPNISAPVVKWVTVIAAVLLLLHSFMCKKCFAGGEMMMKKRR